MNCKLIVALICLSSVVCYAQTGYQLRTLYDDSCEIGQESAMFWNNGYNCDGFYDFACSDTNSTGFFEYHETETCVTFQNTPPTESNWLYLFQWANNNTCEGGITQATASPGDGECRAVGELWYYGYCDDAGAAHIMYCYYSNCTECYDWNEIGYYTYSCFDAGEGYGSYQSVGCTPTGTTSGTTAAGSTTGAGGSSTSSTGSTNGASSSSSNSGSGCTGAHCGGASVLTFSLALLFALVVITLMI